MQIFCIEEFKIEFSKLISKKQYSTLNNDLVEYFFNKEIDDLKNGTNINNDLNTPFIKKRLRGSGGYRVYYLLIVKNDNLYLVFVHPKTGPYGATNIEDKSKAFLLKKVFEAVKTNNLYKLSFDRATKQILFEPQK